MKTGRWPKVVGMFLIALGFLRPIASLAQLPPLPPIPTDPYLDSWSFYDPTNWFSDLGYAPIAFTNIVCDESCWASDDGVLDCNGLLLDSTNAAFLNYNVVEHDGNTNLICSSGTIWFWFSPDWSSTNQGGTGPGDWGRFIDAGAWTSNANYGWWSLFLSPDGDNIYFSGQTNGVGTNYLNFPISWAANSWHLIGLTYTDTNSILYVDGQLATNGLGVSYWPGHDILTNGFWIGSDFSGVEQARGEFVDVETWANQFSSNHFAGYYNHILPELPGGGFTMDDGPPSPGGGGDTNYDGGTGGGASPDGLSSLYNSTNLWLWIGGVSSNQASLFLMNSAPDVLFEIQGRTSLVQGDWISYGFVNGSELTNWTPTSALATNHGTMFYRIRSWADSTGTGIPDWWWLTYFGQITNVDANASAAGDGLSNLQKFQMGLNPTNYYNPNAPAGFYGYVAGTNVFLAWNPSSGAVVNYAIQRGVYNTNTGTYAYSQAGLVSSNATSFEDVGAINNSNAWNNIYNLEAVYPGGSLSPTNTWYVSWYVNYGKYGPPYGPPVPKNVYAYVDSTGTNVLLSWTPALSAATNYIILRGIFNTTNYAWNYTQITNVSPNTTNFEVFGVITNGSNWTDVYEVEAVYPGGGLSGPASSYPGWPSSSSINVGANTNGPTAPAAFYGYTDATGTNIFLTWSPVSGAVTNYIIYGGIFDYTTDLIIYYRLAKLGAATNSFEVVGGVDGSGNNLYSIYNVVAVYTNSSLSQSASWDPYSGAPAPGALSAYFDATGTNVMLSWTPAQGAVSGYVIQRSDYGFPYNQIGAVNSNATSYEDVDAVNTGYFSLDNTIYEVQATYPNGGLSPAVTAMVSNTPPAPSGLSATVDSTGTNVLLSWSPAVGAVTNYIILRGIYNSSTGNYSYSQIGEVNANTTSFEDFGAISGNNGYNNVYEVEALYAGGQLSPVDSSYVYQSSTAPAYNLSVAAHLVRNQTGHWQLMFSGIPASVQAVALYWYDFDYWAGFEPDPAVYEGYPFSVETDIPVSSLTNGIYVIPDFMTTNGIPDNNFMGKVAMVQPIGTNNERGSVSQAGFLPDDSPCFVDGRQHLKQNLLYKLREATISQPNSPLSDNNVYYDPSYWNFGIPADTNYVESSLFHWAVQLSYWEISNDGQYFDGDGENEFLAMDDLWPITANYQLHPSLYDTNYTGPSSFVWQTNLLTVPAPAVLGISDPYWISQNLGNLADVAAYTNSGNLYLQNGVNNLFGLAFKTALVNRGNYYNPVITVAPGGSTGMTNVNCFFSQTVDPSLAIASYYFAPVNTPGTALPVLNSTYQPYPLPALTGFSSTNQTGMLITSVGTPTVIGGWAKFSIQNGSSSKFAYLGQYYVTNAFVMTNGIVTTNTTGVVSPYGDFFPTQPGMVAMVTMPDINTGQQGTGVVRVVGLNVPMRTTMESWTPATPGRTSLPHRAPSGSGRPGRPRWRLRRNGISGVEPSYLTDGSIPGLEPVPNPLPNQPVFMPVICGRATDFGRLLPGLSEHRQFVPEQCLERRHQRHGHQLAVRVEPG